MTNADRFPTGPRWVVHVTAALDSLPSALMFAEIAATMLAAQAPQVDVGSTEVSSEDDQTRRVRVFCDLRLPDGTRCPLPKHQGPCKYPPNSGR